MIDENSPAGQTCLTGIAFAVAVAVVEDGPADRRRSCQNAVHRQPIGAGGSCGEIAVAAGGAVAGVGTGANADIVGPILCEFVREE